MTHDRNRMLDMERTTMPPLHENLFDELRMGQISRREFVRRGSVLGMSLSTIATVLTACGGKDRAPEGKRGQPPPGRVMRGGTLRTGVITPVGSIDPVKLANEGGLTVLSQAGEYLCWSDNELKLQPRLAESWKPNRDGSAWTFKIRQGVKFNDGREMTVEDVARTFERLLDPAEGSAARSAFAGVLSEGGVRAVDASTVRFELDAPNGNFPYLVSSDNFNAVVLPRDYEGDWEKTFIGTGPWRLERYRPELGVRLVKNPHYWDRSRSPMVDRVELKFYAKEQAQVVALLDEEVDVLSHFSVKNGQALLTNPSIRTLELRSSVHRQVHMRTDKEPFTDKRVRQAMALLLNRPALVESYFEGKAELGNDSPFAPIFPSTDPSVPQRRQDVERAKQLLTDAGHGDGFQVQLSTWDGFELPDLAQLIQNDAKAANIRVDLNITDAASYYGDAVFGKSRWLDSAFGITDYGHRGVPNVLLGAPLRSDGTWNAAHFKNERYDALVGDYTKAVELATQRRAARSIQELLLDESPVLFPYFYFYLSATRSNVAGVAVTALGHVDLTSAGFTVSG